MCWLFDVFVCFIAQSLNRMKIIRVSNSSIKGYHFFKRRPHLEVKLLVKTDIHNTYDENAMVVMMPALDAIPSTLHEVILKEARGKEKCQKVKDNANKIIGRVPANVCKLFAELLKQRMIQEVHCFATSIPTLSRSVDPKTSFKRRPNSGKDREGGGAVIPCEYIITCYSSCYNTVLQRLNELEGPEKCT